MEIPEHIKREAKNELARRYFYDYCQNRHAKFYTSDKEYLKDLCDTLQAFTEQNQKRFLVVNIPPRHGKSFTAKNFTEWLFGEKPYLKVMTGSYNEMLSTTFATQVRNTIEERSVGDKTVYRDIFPGTRVKYGEASARVWSLEGSEEKNYLATSPTGTATGFGANYIVIDDVIKNSEEAYNEMVLEKHWDWFTNTIMQRTEGDDWKVIIIMTRWATNDLAGRVLDSYDDVEHVSYKAVQDDGSMLCEAILNKNDYDLKTKEMSLEIVEANYNQKPIDLEGRLYQDFKEYERLPEEPVKRWNYTDTADTGTDFLCSVDYEVHDGDVYITDVVMTDAAMEITESEVAEMLFTDDVDEAIIESNNGGRGFARNIERILMDVHSSNKCVITAEVQIKNKEARILTSSAWVAKHVYMPLNWRNKHREFYKQIMGYQKKGKNKHDDGPDVLAGIYERVANVELVQWGGVR